MQSYSGRPFKREALSVAAGLLTRLGSLLGTYLV